VFVLTLITAHRLVLDQRKEIGVLLALGYRPRRILAAYVLAGSLLGGVGGVVGIGLAFVFRALFSATYAWAIGIPEIVPVVVPRLLAVGVLAAIVSAALATLLPVLRLLRDPPHAIIRPAAQERGGVETWSRLRLWSMARVPLSIRFGLRNMVRQPGRTLCTVAAVGASLGVAIGYVMSLTSALQTSEVVFARERWDVAVDFLYPVLPEDLESIRAIPGVVRIEPYLRRFVEVGNGGASQPATILGIRVAGAMKDTAVRSGRAPAGPSDDEVLVSHDLARRLRIAVGDRVTIRVRTDREFAFTVAGIAGDVSPAQVVIPLDRARAVLELEEAATGVYVAGAGAAASLTPALRRLPYVGKVTTKSGVALAFRQFTSDMMRVVSVACGVSLFVAMLFIVMSVHFTISSRRTEYATLACLGYGGGRLAAAILAQALGEGGCAAVLSVPVGIVLARYINAQMSQAWYDVIDIFRATDVARILILALLLIPLSSYPGLRMLQRLPLVSVLGRREME